MIKGEHKSAPPFKMHSEFKLHIENICMNEKQLIFCHSSSKS